MINHSLRIPAITAIVVVAALVIGFGSYVHANPSFFDRFQSNAATSTLAYMTPGTGTTTLSAINTQNGGFESAVVNLQVTATSTAVVGQVLLNARVEGSMDNVDWYPLAIRADTTLGTSPGTATTTILTSNPYNNFSLALATSTTPAGDFGGTGTAFRMHESFVLPTLTRHVRVVFSDPTAGGKYGLWAEIVTKRQSN